MYKEEDVALLKALADGTRIRIVQCLIGGEQCACSIIPYADKAQPTVSRHLRILENAGIVESRRKGKNIFYKVRDKRAVSILKVVGLCKLKLENKC